MYCTLNTGHQYLKIPHGPSLRPDQPPPPPATAHGQHEWAVKTVTVRPWSGVAARVSDVAGGSGRSGTVGRGRSVGDGRSVTVDRRGSTAAPGDKHGRVDGRGTLIIIGGKETKIKI